MERKDNAEGLFSGKEKKRKEKKIKRIQLHFQCTLSNGLNYCCTVIDNG